MADDDDRVTADQLQTAARVLGEGGSDGEWAVVLKTLRRYLEEVPEARRSARLWVLRRLRDEYQPGAVLRMADELAARRQQAG